MLISIAGGPWSSVNSRLSAMGGPHICRVNLMHFCVLGVFVVGIWDSGGYLELTLYLEVETCTAIPTAAIPRLPR